MKDVGRPTVMTEEVVRKLEDAFANGASDTEAIFYAGVSRTAFYDWQKENPSFTDRKEGLRDMVKYQARRNIVEKIKSGDLETSKWFAERKIKDEFSQRNEHTGAGGDPLTVQVISFNGIDPAPQVSSEELPA